MKIISFGYTTPALLARRKTVTRREWDDRYAKSFKGGEIVQAYDKSPRAGGKKVGEVKLIVAPYKEPLMAMPDTDYEAEGFAFLYGNGHTPPKWSGLPSFSMEAFKLWRQSGGTVWVIRFRVISLEEAS